MKIDHTDLRNLFAAAALTLLPAAAFAGDGVEIMHLSPDNTLVRVEKDARLLLLPVQESNPDARIDILVDGKTDRTINVRLATAKTDYTVPLDLSAYKGKDVVQSYITEADLSKNVSLKKIISAPLSILRSSTSRDSTSLKVSIFPPLNC